MLRIGALGALLAALAGPAGPALAQGLLPLWRLELPLLDARWRLARLWIDQQGADQVVRAEFGLRGCVRLGARTLCDTGASAGDASTLVGNLCLPTVLLLALVLGWPTARRGEWPRRAVALLVGLLLLWTVDVPVTLIASFWGLWRDALLPGQPSLLIAWADFLQGGGRPALALALALAVVHGAARLPARAQLR